MLDVIGKLLESTIGVPVFGLGALTLVFVIYRMARHEILLFGHFELVDPTLRRYSFYVQNLENVSFPGPFCISLTDKRPEARRNKHLVVHVYAGPKHVVKLLSPEGVTERYWSAKFEELPPLDTWLFVCEDESSWLELSVNTGEENPNIEPKLLIDVSRRRLSLREDGSTESYEGLTHTPSLGIFIGTLGFSVLGYLGSIPLLNLTLLQTALRLKPLTFDATDMVVIALIAVLISLGFKSIRRPVYPIIQGYFEETAVIDPTQKTIEPKSGKTQREASRLRRLLNVVFRPVR